MTRSECASPAAAEFVISNSSFLRHSSLVIRHSVILLLGFALATALAQESPTPSPSPAVTLAPTPSSPAHTVRLRFALPPLDGTISLGIYDAAGKLVRVLHREDTLEDFTTGNDALETDWDGKDNTENRLPNGKYSARGFVVGDLKVEGVDYFFNDWVTDDKSPHIRRVTQLWMNNGELQIDVELASGTKRAFVCDPKTGAIMKEGAPIDDKHCKQAATVTKVVDVIDCAPGKDGTTWSIDALAGSGPRQVRQVAPGQEVLRRLEYVAADPEPMQIEASTTEEKIFLVEQNQIMQRFRGLGLVQTKTAEAEGPVSDWKSFFEKKIIEHQNFLITDGKPIASSAAPESGSQKVTQTLQPNPLQNDKPGKIELSVGIDGDGSFLETADGLPLRTISDTPNLTRILLARPNDKTIEVFQDDGAVVEQFRISNLDEMIAFDCGDFELK